MFRIYLLFKLLGILITGYMVYEVHRTCGATNLPAYVMLVGWLGLSLAYIFFPEVMAQMHLQILLGRIDPPRPFFCVVWGFFMLVFPAAFLGFMQGGTSAYAVLILISMLLVFAFSTLLFMLTRAKISALFWFAFGPLGLCLILTIKHGIPEGFSPMYVFLFVGLWSLVSLLCRLLGEPENLAY